MTTENQAPEGGPKLTPIEVDKLVAEWAEAAGMELDYDLARDAAQLVRAALAAQPAPKLDDSEQYRMQMAGISTAALGYWTEADTIHPDYDTVPLRDVAKLYAKYDALYKARVEAQANPPQPAAQGAAEGDTESGVVFAEAAKLFKQIDALLKPHGWPAQKMLRDYVEVVKRAIAAANPQPKGMPAEWLDAFEEWRQTLGAADLDGKRDLVWRHIAGTGFQAGAAWARSQAPAPAPEVLTITPLEEQQMFDDWCPYKGNPDPRVVWAAAIDAVNGMQLQAPAVGAGDGRQDIGGHIRAAANTKVAQQANDDTRRLDYLQKKQATISLVPDGRDENGTRHAFMVGGWHCSVSRDVRASIDAAMGESQPPVQGSQP